MATEQAEDRGREQLRSLLAERGLESTDARVDTLLPGYLAIRAGGERLRSLDLGASDPMPIYRPAPPIG